MESILQTLQGLQVALNNTSVEPTALSLSQWQQLCDAHILTLENQLILLNKLFDHTSPDIKHLQTMHNGTMAILQDAVQFRAYISQPPPTEPPPSRAPRKRQLREPPHQKTSTFTFIARPAKRKEFEDEPVVTSNNKRSRSVDLTQPEPASPPRSPLIEYEDLSEEVDRRLREKKEARKRENKRLATGTMRKRGRKSFETAQDPAAAPPPLPQQRISPPRASKRVKEKHTSLPDEVVAWAPMPDKKQSRGSGRREKFRSVG